VSARWMSTSPTFLYIRIQMLATQQQWNLVNYVCLQIFCEQFSCWNWMRWQILYRWFNFLFYGDLWNHFFALICLSPQKTKHENPYIT
jgi:bacteriorhodopsin